MQHALAIDSKTCKSFLQCTLCYLSNDKHMCLVTNDMMKNKEKEKIMRGGNRMEGKIGIFSFFFCCIIFKSLLPIFGYVLHYTR